MRKRRLDLLTVGFALFAMFFGAGNLIFPPQLGNASGSEWVIGFIGYIVIDVGLAMIAVMAIVKNGGHLAGVTRRVGRYWSTLIGIAVALCIGPFLAIPRTAATAYELGIRPLGVDYRILFSAVYFIIAFLLTIRGGKVIDIVGKVLTPLLLIGLAAMITVGVMSPIGTIKMVDEVGSVANAGITSGYQTLDAFGALLFSIVIIGSVKAKGYRTESDKRSFIWKACLIAGVALFLVYGGLTYLGATTSNLVDNTMSHADLLVFITKKIFGFPGVVLLGVIVILACLTTVIGLTASISAYFEEMSKGKLSYTFLVTAILLIGFLLSCLGLDTIISVSAPVLNTLYPMVLILIVTSFFKGWFRNDNTVKGAAFTALGISLLNTAVSLGISIPLISKLPFSDFGLNWILPAVIGGAIGSFVGRGGMKQPAGREPDKAEIFKDKAELFKDKPVKANS